MLVDDPRHLSWLGRGNVYGAIIPYLSTTPGAADRTTINDFVAWEQSGTEVREAGSRVATAPVWEAADPITTLRRDSSDPSGTFLLSGRLASTDVGARQGPFGSSLQALRLVQRRAPRPVRTPPASTTEVARADTTAAKADSVAPRTSPETERAAAADRTAPVAESPVAPDPTVMPDPMNLPSMPPMPTAGSTESDPDTTPPAEPSTTARPEPVTEPTPAPRTKAAAPSVTTPVATAPTAPDARAPLLAEDVVHGPEQFLAVLRGLAGRGGMIRIAAGVDIDLPSVVIESTTAVPVQISGESGGTRPRLRLRPSPMTGESPTDWTGLFSLRSGTLRLQGLDLVVPEPDTGSADRLAAVALSPGTTLSVSDCTITVPMRRPLATAVVVRPAPRRSRPNARPRMPRPRRRAPSSSCATP